MTVRLGAVTKRGHAEAIFDGFGAFWGWFSLLDLMLVDWLTLVTEFIGMTAALAIFGVPPWLTVAGVCLLMAIMVLNGRYWTWEKIAMVFCALNLIYIPGAFMVHPPVSDILAHGLIPNFPGGFNGQLFFFLMANIGTTIAPWMLFFQQSSVVDKGLKEKDIPWGKFDTLLGAVFTVLVAIFIVIVTGTRAQRPGHRRRRPGVREADGDPPLRRRPSWRSACSTPACSARSASRWPVPGRSAKCSAGRTRSTTRSGKRRCSTSATSSPWSPPAWWC